MNSVTGQPNLSLDSVDCTDRFSIGQIQTFQTPSPHADTQLNAGSLLLL